MNKTEEKSRKPWEKFGMFDVFLYVFLGLLAVSMLFPLWNAIVLSFNDGTDARMGGIYFFPRVFTLANYEKVIKDLSVWKAFGVSVLRTILGSFGSLVVTSLFAYAVSKKDLLFRKVYMVLLLISMFFNAGMIPTFLAFKSLGMYNNFFVYVVPWLFNAFYAQIFISFFKGIPGGLIDSAKIDGAKEWTIYAKLIVPLSKPVFAAVGLFTAINHWNAWQDNMLYMKKRITLMFLSKENKTINWYMHLEQEEKSEQTKPESAGDISAFLSPEDFSLSLKWEEREGLQYLIYKNLDTDFNISSFYLLGKTTNNRYVDNQTQNNRVHFYKIVSRNENGLESDVVSYQYKVDYASPVEFLGMDFETGGNWKGIYGREGYSLRGKGGIEKLPYFITEIKTNGISTNIQHQEDHDCLQRGDKDGNRHFGHEANTGILSYTIIANDTEEHQAAFYCLERSLDKFGVIGKNRKMAMELKMLSGKVLQNDIIVEEFEHGVYLKIRFRGSFVLTLRNMIYLGLLDAVCSGIYFD